MKRIKWLFLFLLLAAVPAKATCNTSSTTPFSVGGNYTVVQYCFYTATGVNDANRAQFTQAVAAGNLLVYVPKACTNISCNGSSGPSPTTVSDNLNGSYSCPAGAAFQWTGGDSTQQFCWFCGTAAGTPTVTVAAFVDWVNTYAFEVHNSSSSCSGLVLDTHASGLGGGGTTPSITAGSATASANELALAGIFDLCPQTITATPGGIWTKVSQSGSSQEGCTDAVAAANVASASTTVSTNWTLSPTGGGLQVLVTLTPFSSGTTVRHRGHVISYRSTPQYRIPWDTRRHKLEIVRI